jgi:hypothetical protein
MPPIFRDIEAGVGVDWMPGPNPGIKDNGFDFNGQLIFRF